MGQHGPYAFEVARRMRTARRKEVVGFIRECIADIKEGRVPEENEMEDLDLIDDLGFDSLDFINILFRVEEVYRFKIPEPEIDEKRLTKVGNLVDYVCTTFE